MTNQKFIVWPEENYKIPPFQLNHRRVIGFDLRKQKKQ